MVTGGAEKRWLAIECCWELAQSGSAVPLQVEGMVSLSTWLFMVARTHLSVFDQVYRWTRENRPLRKAQPIPKEVRRELAVAAVILLTVEQRLDASWFQVCSLFDASDDGGGIVQSWATVQELKEGEMGCTRRLG